MHLSLILINQKSFTDKNGTSKIEMESDGAYLNMPESVTLANRPKTKILTKEIKTTKEELTLVLVVMDLLVL